MDAMDDIQKMFEAAFTETVKHEVILRVVMDKFRDLGITLNKKQTDYIKTKIESRSLGDFKLNIDEKQVKDPSAVKNLSKKKFTIDLASTDSLDDKVNAVISSLTSHMPNLVDDLMTTYMTALKRDSAQKLEAYDKERRGFESRLRKRWKEPLRQLAFFLYFAMELGQEFNEDYRPIAVKERDHVFEALARLHARSCQISLEVLTLIRSGFADGAHARWRTLHEIAVVASFISKYGEEIANRYLCYEVVDSYKAACVYQKNCVRLGYEPLSSKEMDALQKGYEQAKRQFGASFVKGYGWAAPIIEKGAKDKLTFSTIESMVEMGHMRSYYKLASNNVHANPKGIFFKLGLANAGKEILLAGPSNTGFADPATGTIVSIGQITTAFLLHSPNLDRIMACKGLLVLADEIQEAFLKVQFEVEKADKS
jgi:Family of unknown function (DUF5677)